MASNGHQTLAKRNQQQLQNAFESRRAELAQLLPKELDVDRFIKVVMFNCARTPELLECTPKSVFTAAVQAAALGLEPGIANRAHLVKYGKTCTFIPGYEGLRHLAMKTGLYSTIETEVIYEADEFELWREDGETHFLHRPFLDGEAGKMRLIVAWANLREGGLIVERMTAQQLEDFERQYVRAGKGPWSAGLSKLEMQRKTVLLRLLKRLEKSLELSTALEAENSAASGGPLPVEAELDIDADFLDADATPTQEGVERAKEALKKVRGKTRNGKAKASPLGPQKNDRTKELSDRVDELLQKGVTKNPAKWLDRLNACEKPGDFDQVALELDALEDEWFEAQQEAE